MADVTISSLPLGTPSGNAVLPYNQSGSTLATTVSGLYAESNPFNNPLSLRPITKFVAAKNTTNFTLGSGTSGSHALGSFYTNTIENNSSVAARGLEIGAPAGSVTSPVYLKVSGTSNRLSLVDEYNNENLTMLGRNIGINTIAPQATLDVNGSIFTKGYNHIESAMVGPTQASINSILTNEAGYINFDTITNTLDNGSMYISNSNVFKLINTGNYGIQILKSGYLKIDYFQDVVTVPKAAYVQSSGNYVAMYIAVNDVVKARHLISHTAGIWDGLTGHCTLKVNANDVITFYLYCANNNYIKISQLDAISWSYYNFIFWS